MLLLTQFLANNIHFMNHHEAFIKKNNSLSGDINVLEYWVYAQDMSGIMHHLYSSAVDGMYFSHHGAAAYSIAGLKTELWLN